MEPNRREKRPRRTFSPQYKAEVVELARSTGKTPGEIAGELGLTRSAVRAWIEQADIDDGRKDGLTTAEKAELTELRKEVRVLREEREILKKAAAFFAKETR